MMQACFVWSAQTCLRFQSGDTYTRKGYAVVVRGLSPNNTRRPHSKGETS